MQHWLSWCHWLETWISACFCLLSSGIKSICQLAWQNLNNYFYFNKRTIRKKFQDSFVRNSQKLDKDILLDKAE